VRAAFDLGARRSITLSATVNFTLWITDLYVDVASFDDVVMLFSNMSVSLPTVAPTNDLEQLLPPTVLTTVVLAPSTPLCNKTFWSSPGAASLGTTPLMVFRDTRISLYQSSDYAHGVEYASFERPLFNISVRAFLQNTFTTSCATQFSDSRRADAAFTSLQCCFGEGSPCSVWIGQSGWVYWGTPAEPEMYGVRLAPSWSWSGTRRDLVTNSSNVVDVRPILVGSAFFPPTVTHTTRPRLEFYSFSSHTGGVVRLFAGENGALQRYVRCAILSLAAGTTFVVDFQSRFQPESAALSLYNPTTNLWEFVYDAFIVSLQTQTSPPVATFVLAIMNEPANFVIERHTFAWDSTLRQLSVKFALKDTMKTRPATVTTGSVGATTPMPTNPPTPLPTPPTFSCQRNCNGHGLCLGENFCECFNGYSRDGNLGCVDADLVRTTVAQSRVTVTVKGDAVAETSAIAAETSETQDGGTTIDAMNTTASGGGASGTTADVPVKPMIGDVLKENLAAIAGGAAGAAALICIAVVVCVVVRHKRRRHTKLEESTSMPNNADELPMKTYARNTDYLAFNSGAATQAYAGASLTTGGEVYTVPAGMGKEDADQVYHVPKMPTEASGDYKSSVFTGTGSGSDTVYAVPTGTVELPYQDIALTGEGPTKKSGIHEPAETADLTPYHEYDVDDTRFRKYKD